ncbi:MAG: ABC transporter ATP-binding protein [Planctomycetes bacterium]|nr:ABC transporter ATP-binding protein [Planctomycetota bacterium]
MIRITNLRKRFGRFTAVDDVSLVVAPGEAVALWGANGAGKTTAIRCVLGLLSFQGTVTVDGRDVRREGKAARRSMGYVPQELALYDDFRLHETLQFFARLKRVPRARAPVVLREVGLEEHRRKRVRELSGGMKQRLALAVALLADPPALVLDELTSNLDAAAQAGFMSLLRTLRQGGKTILFTSHHLPEVEVLADRVVVMKAGRIEFECGPDDLGARVGARCLLKVFLAEGVMDTALGLLLDRGFSATRNGRGLHVEVPVDDKAAPLRALGAAEITVNNFEVAALGPAEAEAGGIDGV